MTVEDGVLDWAPRLVVMCGIAYSIKHPIGTILIADKVRYVDSRKEGTDKETRERVTISRGSRPEVPAKVLAIFDDTRADSSHLPLLQVTLDNIWRRGRLTLNGSDGIPVYNSLVDSFNTHAGDVIKFRWRNGKLTEERRPGTERTEILSLLLDLVRVTDTCDDPGRHTRVPRQLASLASGDERRQALIKELSDARLLSTRRDEATDEKPGVELRW